MVVGIRRGRPSKIISPSPNEPLQAEDNLVIVSNDFAIAKLTREFQR